MGRPSKDVARLALHAFVLTIGTCIANGQDGSSQRQLRLAELARLSDAAKVDHWVSSELHAELRLWPNESLTVARPLTQIGEWAAYSIVRSVNGLPVVHQEFRLFLDPRQRPVVLLGPLKNLALTRQIPPDRTLDKPDEVGSIPNEPSVDARLVYWPDRDSLRLCYMIESASGSDQLIMDARTNAVLARIPLLHAARKREVYDFESACRSASVRRPMKTGKSHRVLAVAIESRHRRHPLAFWLAGLLCSPDRAVSRTRRPW